MAVEHLVKVFEKPRLGLGSSYDGGALRRGQEDIGARKDRVKKEEALSVRRETLPGARFYSVLRR
jgi:hypothetical protein